MPKSSQLVANDVTLDITPVSSSSVLEACHRPALVEGSSPQLTTETTDILRTRLRAAAGILFIGFLLFFLYRLYTGAGPGGKDNFTFYFHFAVTIVLGSSFALLCRRCKIPLAVLRGYELAIFGLPVLYFVVYDHRLFEVSAPRHYVFNPLPFWMGVVFTYAILIPNTWRRAAIVTGIICALPLALIGYMALTNRAFAEAYLDESGFVVEVAIMLSITCLCSVYGTYVINTLRTEAFEARQLGQYRLCRLIGSGGMGEVYLAEHQMMKRPCAIKLIRPAKAGDPKALARFEREVRATAKLSHWNTIEIFDYGRADDGTFYYVMEYLPGLSLAELVEKHGPLPPARAIHLLMQTCDALAEAHANGLIHRDIKPGNIFAAQRGGVYDVAKLLDFGLAKPVSTEEVPVALTQEGSIAGSPLYMSPEQALGDSEPDARSDIYSLGAVAYYLLTGVPPFDGDKAIKIILAHAQQQLVPPSRLRPEIPADLEQVVMRMLAKKPADRFRDVVSLRQSLADCVAAGGWTHVEAANWWQSKGATNGQAESLTAAALS